MPIAHSFTSIHSLVFVTAAWISETARSAELGEQRGQKHKTSRWRGGDGGIIKDSEGETEKVRVKGGREKGGWAPQEEEEGNQSPYA